MPLNRLHSGDSGCNAKHRSSTIKLILGISNKMVLGLAPQGSKEVQTCQCLLSLTQNNILTHLPI